VCELNYLINNVELNGKNGVMFTAVNVTEDNKALD
jgi:hypothetical protein